MRKTLFSIVLIVALVVGQTAGAQSLIPQPQQMELLKGDYLMADGVNVASNLKGKDLRFMKQYLAETLHTGKILPMRKAGEAGLVLRCTGTREQAERAVNDTTLQGYELSVDKRGVYITSLTPMGLFYGIQTLRQLRDKNNLIPYVNIADSPRFLYRGLMIDCSRHFWTPDFIKKQIDAIAYFKMDRLHLHLVDAGGWRVEIKHYPKLITDAAYRTESDWSKWWEHNDRHYCKKDAPGAYGGFYTQKELREIVKYAADRHIVVVPEIEMPGHSEEVLFAYPELSCKGKPYTSGDFCVGNEKTFEFLQTVLKEVMRIFPSKYIHIGGDESGRKGWETCPKCQKRMRDNGLANTAELQSYLTSRIEKFLNAHGRMLLGWDEIMEGKLAPNATVMSWRGEEGGLKAADAEHDAIMTPGKYCYLDHYQDIPATEPKAMGGYMPLEMTYSYNPLPEGSDAKLRKHIIGIQGNLWTEYVKTPEHAEYMIYPRLLAIAETGWTRKKGDFKDFRHRAVDAVHELQSMGYHPFDLDKEVGRRAEAKSLVSHQARGCKVVYNAPYSKYYTASADQTLTDGKRGNWDYSDGVWQGFIDKGFDAVVELDSLTDVKEVQASFMQSVGAEIYIPTEVVLSVSKDGATFEVVDRRKKELDRSKDYFIYDYKWKGNVKAKYVRIQAKSGVSAGWIFTDEIIVNPK